MRLLRPRRKSLNDKNHADLAHQMADRVGEIQRKLLAGTCPRQKFAQV